MSEGATTRGCAECGNDEEGAVGRDGLCVECRLTGDIVRLNAALAEAVERAARAERQNKVDAVSLDMLADRLVAAESQRDRAVAMLKDLEADEGPFDWSRFAALLKEATT